MPLLARRKYNPSRVPKQWGSCRATYYVAWPPLIKRDISRYGAGALSNSSKIATYSFFIRPEVSLLCLLILLLSL
jgi:hypothetical protein